MSDLLTFQELRDKCLRHLKEKIYLYTGSCKLEYPDANWLKDEFAEIRDSLKSNEATHNHTTLRDAFYSVVYQLEHGIVVHPNSLIVLGTELCRVINFEHKYPVEISYKVFVKAGYGKVKKSVYRRVLNKPIQIVLLKDPLIVKPKHSLDC